MATWGPRLYQDDLADDVRSYYKDQLHRGKTGAKITQELIRQNAREIEDIDDAPVFWFALADTQWDMGRLEDDVKNMALYYIDSKSDLMKWSQADPREFRTRKKVLEDLKNKLLSPQPEEKKMSQYKLYHCDWKDGDVFAYKLCGDYAESRNMHDYYVYFVKVCNGVWYPGHTVPVVYFYWVTGDRLLEINELKTYSFIPQFYKPEVYIKNPKAKKLYSIELLSTSSRVIPRKRLIYIGNVGKMERMDNEKDLPYDVSWKELEKYIIDNFIKWDKYR